MTEVARGAGHQSIGRNGSFWLPPDTQSQKFENLLPPKKSPQNIHEAKGSDSQDILKFSRNNGSLSSQPSFSLKNLSGKQSFQASPNDKQFLHVLIPSSSKFKSHPDRSAFPASKSTLPQVNSVLSSSNFSENPSFPLPSAPPVTKPLSKGMERISQFPRRGGMQYALFTNNHTSYDENDKTEPSTISDQSQISQVDVDDVSKILFSSNPEKYKLINLPEGQLVRFAVDLPNGNGVSVRILSESSKTQIAFICPEKEAFDYISNTFFAEEINSSMHCDMPVELFLFSSFEQLDKFNHDK